MNEELRLGSLRSRKARARSRLSRINGRLLIICGGTVATAATFLLLAESSARPIYGSGALGLALMMAGLWLEQDLKRLAPSKNPKTLDDIIEPALLASFGRDNRPSPKRAWQLAVARSEGRFMISRLLLPAEALADQLSDDPGDMVPVWRQVRHLAETAKTGQLDGGTLVAALLFGSQPVMRRLAALKLNKQDILAVLEWLERVTGYSRQPKSYFGGIGRDWASGYTPQLERYGQNISRQVEAAGGHFHTLAGTELLDTLVYNLAEGHGSIAIIGEAGTGKSSLVGALAERLLSGRDKKLEFYQIFSLNASAILSAAKNQLERVMLNLLGEAARAGNIILFLDEARLFFSNGTGSFDAARILLPLLKNSRVKIIAAFTPTDFQRLRAENESLAAAFSTVTVTEPDEATTMDILEDSALSLEHRSGLLVSFAAVKEAYRLSGRYLQEAFYPGKAIDLLEQSAAYAQQRVITAAAVAKAVETARGVRVSRAEAPEADLLLHLEQAIHTRMINQSRAVGVVAASLRRSRAGVSSAKRPVGSFLFLGPTGVGKTELARSLAAVYFGDEQQMIRLDMSEYQRPGDLARLLDGGERAGQSLILAVRKQPFAVVLLDEIEKAHPTILNLFLQLLDEGRLTDSNGRAASFQSAMVIATSNAGSTAIIERVGRGERLEDFERPLINKLIAEGQFKPELINRFDEVVLFRPLDEGELGQVAKLMLDEINRTLAAQNIKVTLTDAALGLIVKTGYDPQFGARPMRRTMQKMVEDAIASRILGGQLKPGQELILDAPELFPPG